MQKFHNIRQYLLLYYYIFSELNLAKQLYKNIWVNRRYRHRSINVPKLELGGLLITTWPSLVKNCINEINCTLLEIKYIIMYINRLQRGCVTIKNVFECLSVLENPGFCIFTSSRSCCHILFYSNLSLIYMTCNILYR